MTWTWLRNLFRRRPAPAPPRPKRSGGYAIRPSGPASSGFMMGNGWDARSLSAADFLARRILAKADASPGQPVAD